MTSTQEKSQEVNAKERMAEIQTAIDANQGVCDRCGSVAVFWATRSRGDKVLIDTVPNPKGGWHVTESFGKLHAKDYGWEFKNIAPNERRTRHEDTCPRRVPSTLVAS